MRHLVVADSSAVFRLGVRNVLERDAGFEVVEAHDRDDLVETVGRWAPELALVELELPPAGGVATLAALREASASTIAVVWGHDPAPATAVSALRAGAAGCLDKGITPNGLVRALKGVEAGEIALSRRLWSHVLSAMRVSTDANEAQWAAALSGREREVFALVARGARNRQIAETLGISEFTVKQHVHNILRKLGAPSRFAASAFYRENASGQVDSLDGVRR
jgi:DNA-binding NarL/FixJ family response regulator